MVKEMKWISVKDGLPDDGDHCWTCSEDKIVEDAYYIFAPIWINDVRENAGIFEDAWGSAIINVEFWKLYFTPDPPEDYIVYGLYLETDLPSQPLD